jgi:succinate dehydrogenase/fumarate reductase iron-sulfur protein
VKVNGIPVLACKERIANNLKDGMLVIEPLRCFPLVKDLVVDLSFDLHERARKRLFPETGGKKAASQVNETGYNKFLAQYSLCIRCAACMEICPVYGSNSGNFAGPLYFLEMAKLYLNPIDHADRKVQAATEGIQLCDACGKCNEVCPMDLEVFEMSVGILRNDDGTNSFIKGEEGKP